MTIEKGERYLQIKAMVKDKFAVFKLEEYDTSQQECLNLLYKKYPDYKWLQMLSPFHCYDMYYSLCNMEEHESICDQIENIYKEMGHVTVYLEYAIKICRATGRTNIMESILCRKDDADALAKKIFEAMEITLLPQRVHYMHRKEFDNDLYILRDMWTDEALNWCLDYVNLNIDMTNIVCVWNMYKSKYYKSLQEDFYDN